MKKCNILHKCRCVWVMYVVNFQEAFNAFHNDLPAVKKYLKPIRVGAVEKYEDTEINKDFRKLKETALKMVRAVPNLARWGGWMASFPL